MNDEIQQMTEVYNSNTKSNKIPNYNYNQKHDSYTSVVNYHMNTSDSSVPNHITNSENISNMNINTSNIEPEYQNEQNCHTLNVTNSIINTPTTRGIQSEFKVNYSTTHNNSLHNRSDSILDLASTNDAIAHELQELHENTSTLNNNKFNSKHTSRRSKKDKRKRSGKTNNLNDI